MGTQLRAQSDILRLFRTSLGSTGSLVGSTLPAAHDDRVSFELRDEDVEAVRAKVANLATLKVHHLSSLAPAHHRSLPATLDELHAFEEWQGKHPCIIENFEAFTALLKGKRLAVFLDYDGTLTPIVSNPDEATLSESARCIIQHVAKQFPTAIISGRGREKVESFVQLKELYYAGSHGMDIAGPKDLQNGHTETDSSFQPAAHYRPLIDKVYKQLVDRLSCIPGAYVEHNTFCVSAHFRNCPGESWQQVVQTVDEIVGQQDELRMTRGRKVVEVRPKVNWHKGTALNHLLGVLGLKGKSDVVAIYVGDDHTDEDAFKALAEGNQGFGILVTTKVKETAAKYTVKDPSQVHQFLDMLVQWGRTLDNGWLSNATCTGWSPAQQAFEAPLSKRPSGPQHKLAAAPALITDNRLDTEALVVDRLDDQTLVVL